ncbi:MAG: hypothetical protein C0403_12565 [Desulfobacterium sp.]|nr:hypothetical protein [Desulfobacterium sp.]
MLSREDMKKIAVGVAIPIVIALVWFVFGKAKMIWVHVDEETPVSTQTTNITKVTDKVLLNESTLQDLSKSLETTAKELETLKKGLIQEPVRGRLSREIGVKPTDVEGVYVNTNSDARKFQLNENLLVQSNGVTVPVRVIGTITNEKEIVIGKLNALAAQKLGLTEKKGVVDWAILKRPER